MNLSLSELFIFHFSFALFLVLKLAVDVSFDQFEPTLIKLFQQGQHRTEYVFVSIIIVLNSLISICKTCIAARGRTPMRCIMSWIEWHKPTTISNDLSIVPHGCHTSISVRCLLTCTSGRVLLTDIVSHVVCGCLRCLMLRQLRML